MAAMQEKEAAKAAEEAKKNENNGDANLLGNVVDIPKA